MALKDDVNQGLRAIGRDPSQPFSLDARGECEIEVEIPATLLKLAGKKLIILVRMSPSGRFFTFLAPIAVARTSIPAAAVNQLFGDQLRADHVQGTSFALNHETGIVFASYHWVLPSISPEQFAELFQHFASATFTMIDRIGAIAQGMQGLSTIRDEEIR